MVGVGCRGEREGWKKGREEEEEEKGENKY